MIEGVIVECSVQIDNGMRRIGLPKQFNEGKRSSEAVTLQLTMLIPPHVTHGEIRKILGQGVTIVETNSRPPRIPVEKEKKKRNISFRG